MLFVGFCVLFSPCFLKSLSSCSSLFWYVKLIKTTNSVNKKSLIKKLFSSNPFFFFFVFYFFLLIHLHFCFFTDVSFLSCFSHLLSCAFHVSSNKFFHFWFCFNCGCGSFIVWFFLWGFHCLKPFHTKTRLGFSLNLIKTTCRSMLELRHPGVLVQSVFVELWLKG